MSVSLTNNFLANARGLQFKDANGVAWSFNSSTNELSAAVAAAQGGTVTSVGLADGSTAPIYSSSNSPVTVSGTLTFTLIAQSANTVLAGPASGAAAQPTFRALVAADIQTISPTWTGTHKFSPSSDVAITVNGAAATWCADLIGNAASGQSYGLYVAAGTTSADFALSVYNQAQATPYLQIYGEGSVVVGSASGGRKGVGTINAVGLYVQGTAVVMGSDPWIAPTLLNSWTNYGAPFTTAGYYKDANGRVYLRGTVKGGSSSSAIIMTLPAGYLPAFTQIMASVCQSAFAEIRVDTSGNVWMNTGAGTTWVSLDNLSFLTS